MSNETCILTTKDFTIVEVMLDRCLGADDPMAPLLRRKLDAARVVFRDDVPDNVATLSSRVSFSVSGKEPEMRILSHDRVGEAVGLFMPITTPRGLALLGLSEGQEFHLDEGGEEYVRLEKVAYQPEASRRAKEQAALRRPAGTRPVFSLIQGGRPATYADFGSDDPGPSAA